MWDNGRHIDIQTVNDAYENSYIPLLLFHQMYLFSVLYYKTEVQPTARRNHPVLTWFLRAWNAGWAVFSAVGFWHTAPILWTLFQNNTCTVQAGRYSNTQLWWFYLYVVTKPWEFVDTWLLMLRGRRVPLLHWSHHWLTALYVVYAKHHMLSGGLAFAVLNYGVHAVMYAYYCLTSFGIRYGSAWVTRLQLSQFVVAIGSWLYFAPCYSWTTSGLTVTMYSYYFFLFWRMYRKRYRKLSATSQATSTPVNKTL